jgi:putative peptidoglycan lipid II flippase
LLVLGTVLWFATGSESEWLNMPFAKRLVKLALIVVAGIVSYFATLALLGFRLADFKRRSAP